MGAQTIAAIAQGLAGALGGLQAGLQVSANRKRLEDIEKRRQEEFQQQLKLQQDRFKLQQKTIEDALKRKHAIEAAIRPFAVEATFGPKAQVVPTPLGGQAVTRERSPEEMQAILGEVPTVEGTPFPDPELFAERAQPKTFLEIPPGAPPGTLFGAVQAIRGMQEAPEKMEPAERTRILTQYHKWRSGADVFHRRALGIDERQRKLLAKYGKASPEKLKGRQLAEYMQLEEQKQREYVEANKRYRSSASVLISKVEALLDDGREKDAYELIKTAGLTMEDYGALLSKYEEETE